MISPPVLVQSPGSTKLSEAPSNVIKKKKKKTGSNLFVCACVCLWLIWPRLFHPDIQHVMSAGDWNKPRRTSVMTITGDGFICHFRNYNKKVQGFSISVLSPWSSHVPSVLAWVSSRFSWLGCDIQHFSDYSYRWFHFCQIADKVNW